MRMADAPNPLDMAGVVERLERIPPAIDGDMSIYSAMEEAGYGFATAEGDDLFAADLRALLSAFKARGEYLRQLADNADVARGLLPADDIGSIVASALGDTIHQARASITPTQTQGDDHE